MSPPCKVTEGVTEDGQVAWLVTSRASGKGPADTLRIFLEEIHSASENDLGIDPGLQKDGVAKHLKELLPAHPAKMGRPSSRARGCQAVKIWVVTYRTKTTTQT